MEFRIWKSSQKAGGREMDFKYKDCKAEMDMVNRAFIETMIEGDANVRGFQYPIPTYSITKDFDWSDTENNRLLFVITSRLVFKDLALISIIRSRRR